MGFKVFFKNYCKGEGEQVMEDFNIYELLNEFVETTIEDILDEEFDPWEFCWELFDESVECNEYGCYTTDDTLNAMCSEIWEEIAHDTGLLDEFDEENDEENYFNDPIP